MEPVDLALCLAVDASSSVDYREFDLMLGGSAAAFRDPEIAAAILSGRRQAIAIAMLMWSGLREQEVAIGWTRIDNAAALGALADRIEALPRLVPPGVTALGEAIAAGLALLGRCPAEATRNVLDVSGDGSNNRGREPGPVRDIGVAAGVTINGLAVVNEEPDLVAYYRAEVIGGPGSFVMATPDYRAFAEAIREKLLREIGGVAIA